MPVMMSVSTLSVFIWFARSRMSATVMSVVTLSAMVVMVLAMVAGSLCRTFCTTAAITMRWLAARYRSPSPYAS